LGRWALRAPDQTRSRPAVPVRRLLAEKLPLLGLALASCLLTLRAQARGEAIAPLGVYPLDVRVLNAMQSYVTYLAKAAWPVALAWGLGDLAEAVGARGLRIGLSAAAVAALTACAFRTWEQVGTWRNSRTLWEHAVRVTPSNSVAHNNLGQTYLDSGSLVEAW